MGSAYEGEWIVVEVSCLSPGNMDMIGAWGDDGDAAKPAGEMAMDATD